MTHVATPPRRAALGVLRAVRGGALVDRVLPAELARLPERERAWTQELVYGTLRLRGRLDHALAQRVRRSLDSLDADVLDVLRLGAYQLTEMDSVPAYAAVSQSVELTRWAGVARAAGLVNGVLNGLHRDAARLTFPRLEEDPAAHLSTWGSHPRWLVERWIERFGVEAAHAIIEANNRRPELYLRAVGSGVAEVQRLLAECGIDGEPLDYAPDALRLKVASRLAEALAASPVIVQDPAAGLIVRAAAAPPGARVIDLCAAPGGKALGLASGTRAGAPRVVAAADLSRSRLGRLEDNLARLLQVAGALTAAPAGGRERGVPRAGEPSFIGAVDVAGVVDRVALVVADARRPPFRPADLVLVDAPCTGTGTLRRHPDGRWRIGPAELQSLATLQTELLAAAATIVAPGGVLVYSTCSIEEEENGQQVEAFLRSHPEFEEEPVQGIDDRAIDGAGRLRVLPHVFGVDGAFAARLRRRAA